jgi:hypothetical protein
VFRRAGSDSRGLRTSVGVDCAGEFALSLPTPLHL